MWPFRRKAKLLETQEDIDALSPILFEEEEGMVAYKNFSAFEDRLLTQTLPTSTCCYDADGYEIPLQWIKKPGASPKGRARALRSKRKKEPDFHYLLEIKPGQRTDKSSELKQKIRETLETQQGISLGPVTPLFVCIAVLQKQSRLE